MIPKLSIRLGVWLIGFGAIGIAVPNCSLLLKDEPVQCSSDNDCEGRGFHGWRCDTGVCVDRGPADGSTAPMNDGGALDAEGAASDGPEAFAEIDVADVTAVSDARDAETIGALDASDAGADEGGSPEPPCQSGACSAAGGSCVSGVCVIECTAPNSCSHLQCPANMPCRVNCGSSACRSGVSCRNASSCSIFCDIQSCVGIIECGGTSCKVECAGVSACGNLVTCAAATCDIRCTGQSSCGQVSFEPGVQGGSLVCSADQSCGSGILSAAAKLTIACGAINACAGTTRCLGECSRTCTSGNACGPLCCGAGACTSPSTSSCP